MRASSAVGLLFAGSMSIFGIFASGRHGQSAQAIEPVWVNGQMGVYSPYTGEFVPSTDPNYADVCDQIRDQRGQSGIYSSPTTGPSGYGGSTYYHNGYYYHNYGSSYGGASGVRGSSSLGSSSSFGSSRGGIGSIGHAMGGGSSS